MKCYNIIILILLIIGSVIVAADITDLEGEHLNNTNKEEYRHTYQPYEETTTFYDNTVNKVYFSTITFTDSKGTLLKDTYSLMNCEFCSEIRLTIETDKDFPIKIIDFNLTSIKIVPQLTDNNLDINIPLKVNNLKSKTVNQSLLVTGNKVGDTAEVKLPFGFDKEIKYGFNSTTIKINISSGVLDFYYYDGFFTLTGGFFIKFNTTALPLNSILLDATLNLHLYKIDTPYTNVTIWSINNKTWVNSSIIIPLANNLTRLRTYPQNYSFTPTTSEYKRFNVTNQTRPYIVNGNVTYNIEGSESPTQEASLISRGGSNAYTSSVGISAYFNNAENMDGTGNTPYLNLTYIPGVNITLGVFNNTYYNYTDGVIYSNSSAGNGSYTSTVFALNGAYNQLNITASTESQAGYEVQGSVRTSTIFTNVTSKVIAYYAFNTVKQGDTTIQDNTGIWQNLVSMHFERDNGRYELTQNSRFEGGIYGNGTPDTSNSHSFHSTTPSQIVPLFNNATNGLTICIYMNISNSSTLNSPFNYVNSFAMKTRDSNGSHFKIQTDCWNTTGGNVYPISDYLRDNVWTFYCAVKNSTHCFSSAFNVDYPTGNLKSFALPGSTIATGAGDNGLVVYGNQYTADNRGYADDFMIINESLTLAQIKLIYDNIDYSAWQTYQSFSSGIDTKNYSIANTSTFAQAKFLMFSNSTYNTKLYGFNWTGWNWYAEAAAGVCACGTPASCITQWTWNMSCYCNITTPYYCPATYINMDTSAGIWNVSTTVAGRFDFNNGTSTNKIIGNASGWLNTS